MKASEARRIVKEIELDGFEEILDDIREEATKGNTYTYWYGRTSDAIARELNDLGYSLTEYGDSYKISWDD